MAVAPPAPLAPSALCALLAPFALLLASSAAAEETAPRESEARAAPRRTVATETLLESRARGSSPKDDEARERALRDGEGLLPAPTLVFRRELDQEARRYRDTSPWALVPEGLAQGRAVREGRAKAAERALSEAFEAGAEAALRDAVLGPIERRLERLRPERPHDRQRDFAPRLEAGFRIDTSPSWRLERRAFKGGTLRLDVPLTPDAVRLRWDVGLPGGRSPRSLGASVSVDAFDGTGRFGVSCRF